MPSDPFPDRDELSLLDAAVIAEVLALDEQLKDAQHDWDLATVERLYAPELRINSPTSRVQSREETIEGLRSKRMRQTDLLRTIEAAYTSGPDVVVVMGHESLVWEGTGTDLDGKRTARRFTNVWRRIDGMWRKIARQATTVPIAVERDV